MSQAQFLRTVALLAGALVSAVVALWPLLARGQSRAYSWRLSIVALLSTAAFVAAIFLPGVRRPVAQPLVDLPPLPTIGPGTAVAVAFADGTGGMACTAGFLVRTTGGDTGLLTAGHCNKAGEASRVSMNSGARPYQSVGTFTQTVSEGTRGEAHDIGLITLDSDTIPRSASIAGSMPVARVADAVQVGQQLCKFGMKTGRVECGQVTEVTESKVVFLAASQCGDSGGPVYLIQPDGAAAVGIHIRGGRMNDPNPGCSIPATFSVAELVRPWLDQWGLTVVTG
ncbi:MULTISPECIES: S1 family peptidase [unclassified Mycobacterium]|uniref:S1 family peptidase n=1 Tax=unclassified Mycobacterium TaxID=2642494 RepID=UPI000FABF0D4|nr:MULTISPECIES: S1 family peptidase [unclassified Mycobacterium]MDP7702415.1 S1 family peptidase [Mycobacterium sp. TY815]MDP7720908.1 S1 family peptidase [Mycobacterium sp. TY814]RUP01500.1 MAG: trypsin-like serine protease [Mycobacterium sp.]